jgi:hypothetical protein
VFVWKEEDKESITARNKEAPHKKSKVEGTSFDDLPPEMELHVFGFLPAKSLGCSECVCRQWRDLLKADKLLRTRKQAGIV